MALARAQRKLRSASWPCRGFHAGERGMPRPSRGVEVSECVCANRRVCLVNRRQKWGLLSEKICTTSRFPDGAGCLKTDLCNSSKWTNVGLCVSLLPRKTVLEFFPFPCGNIFHKCTYRRLHMPQHPSGSNNVVVQLYIFIDTPGADTPWDWMDVSADASSVEKTLFLDQGGLLACGRWWLLEVVSSLDLPLSQALHHPGYVTGALIPTAKKYW